MSPEVEQEIERWLGAINLQRALWTLALVVFLIAWNRGIALLYGIFALIIGALTVAWLVPRWNLRGITAQRTVPAQASEGENITVEIGLQVSGPWSRYLLEVQDALPFAAADRQQPCVFFPRTRCRATLRYTIACDLRGLHSLGPLELRSSYPLGISTARRRLPHTAGQLLVNPATFAIAALPLLGDGRWPISGVRTMSRAGGNDEFLGVREYRVGDNARHIHWPASARQGELVVREHEHLQTTEVILALDLRRSAQFGSGKHSTLEYMVKIAASIARHVLEQGHSLGLYAQGKAPIEVPVGHGPQHFQTILEVLARVRGEGATPYEQVTAAALARLAMGGVLVTFDIPEAGRSAPRELAGAYTRHARVIPIHFDGPSFTGAATGGTQPNGGYLVRRGDDLAGLFA
ncbi:MAG: DUF58 domain-containing protein [Desulfobulbaceae bacterium]|nr:DUF58 domain-containing protein [Desulfobulbaceae bacterium]